MFHHESRIPLDWRKPVTVFFFGDLQEGAEGFSLRAWEEFRDEFESQPNSYAIGLGDYGDWLRPTMRARLYGALSHDDSARRQQDDLVRKAQDKLLDTRLAFLEGRLLGLHDGHHQWDFADGSNSTQRLCSALKTTYLGWQASTRMIMTGVGRSRPGKKTAGGSDCGLAYTIITMHGSGSARHATTDSRWLEANIVPAFVADFYAKGHGCKNVAWSPFKRCHVRRRGRPGMDEVTVRCLNVGGFHQGYTDGWQSSYVERNGFTPQAMGWGRLRLSLQQNNDETGKQRTYPILKAEHDSRFPSDMPQQD